MNQKQTSSTNINENPQNTLSLPHEPKKVNSFN